MSLSTRVVREVLVVALGGVIGLFVLAVAVLSGIGGDVVGVVFHDPADHPYEDAWMAGSVLLAVGAAGATWWLAGRRGSQRVGGPRK